jgi:hypothetical protein
MFPAAERSGSRMSLADIVPDSAVSSWGYSAGLAWLLLMLGLYKTWEEVRPFPV